MQYDWSIKVSLANHKSIIAFTETHISAWGGASGSVRTSFAGLD